MPVSAGRRDERVQVSQVKGQRETKGGAGMIDQIICGDCLEKIKNIPEKSIDAVITDPPYSLTSASSRRSADKAMGWGDVNNASVWFSIWYAEVWRVLKDTGCFWTFCNWKSLAVVQCAAARVPGMYPISVLVWDKDWPSVGSMRGLRQHYEMVALFGKPDFAIQNRSIGDIWKVKWSSHKPHGYAAEKPEELIRQLIAASGIPVNGVILDPFLGSGTTAVECVRAGLHYIGVEISQEAIEIAQRRITAVPARLDRWAEAEP